MQVSSNRIPTVLPDEIIFNILHFLDPCSVVQLCLVSKQFSDVARDARLWRTFYINSCLPRPSGPFLWQSTRFLQHALIHSAHLSRTWTSQPMSITSSVQGPRVPTKPYSVSIPSDFLFGRLFIWCEHEQILVQDLETGMGRVLWQSTEPISSLNACSLTFPNAVRVFVAIRHVDAPLSQRTPMHVKLLEFSSQDDIHPTLGPLVFEMDLPEYVTFPLLANAPFLYFHADVDRVFGSYEPMVLDVRTRTAYRFPKFSSRLDEAGSWWPGFTMFSGGYIVVFSPWQYRDPPMTLVQSFVVPDPLEDPSNVDIGRLHLTHEVLVEYYLAPTHCLRNATVDTTTGETILRFLGSDPRHGQTHYLCIDVTIPPVESDTKGVLPMSVETRDVFVLSGYPQATFLDTSNEGHGRGIITLSRPPDPPQPCGHPLFLYKFSIDASGENCTAVVSEPNRLIPQDAFHYADLCVFDGIRGRVCHNLKRHCDFFDLMVLDLH